MPSRKRTKGKARIADAHEPSPQEKQRRQEEERRYPDLPRPTVGNGRHGSGQMRRCAQDAWDDFAAAVYYFLYGHGMLLALQAQAQDRKSA